MIFKQLVPSPENFPGDEKTVAHDVRIFRESSDGCRALNDSAGGVMESFFVRSIDGDCETHGNVPEGMMGHTFLS